MFLKTHKTASTTVQNLVLRFADSRNLTLAIPTDKKRFRRTFKYTEDGFARAVQRIERSFHLILIVEHFDESMILLKETMCWDIDDVIAFNHNSRGEKDHKNISEDVAKGILEWNSLDWRLYQHFNMTFWAKIEKMFSPARLQEELAILRERRRFLEQQCCEDGLFRVKKPGTKGAYFKSFLHMTYHKKYRQCDPTFMCSEDKHHVSENPQDRQYHEHFDESMILLKETMCWDIDDVIAFNHNSRGEKDHKNISEDVAKGILEWNSLDWRLYQHFNMTFWAKIEKMFSPARLQEELAILRERRKFVEKQCCEDGLFRKYWQCDPTFMCSEDKYHVPENPQVRQYHGAELGPAIC
ncbi:hypothetical protein JZ751_023538 [Albula glossodonta]|uniref:Uncharacterized protein n=1 Tax=Albula glossodonta TaxID=121402 RepID=A0A8T2MYA5_9TELE|nr:hypothetical protein JZ751_023538 [Albula glossodonta]